MSVPGPDQVRPRQPAAGRNYIDVYHRTGYYPQPLRFIPGIEGAGTVEAVAEDARTAVNQRFALKDAADAHKDSETRATSRLHCHDYRTYCP